MFSAEDEQQQKTFSCSKSVRQLSAERDQAIADLNSVERSFADLFRRYENMKGVLEGFKKVSRALALGLGFWSRSWYLTFPVLSLSRMRRSWRSVHRTTWWGSNRRSSDTKPSKCTLRRNWTSEPPCLCSSLTRALHSFQSSVSFSWFLTGQMRR